MAAGAAAGVRPTAHIVGKVTELRRAPVVGHTYLVPTIRAPYYQMVDDWPVRGAPHQELPLGIIDQHLDRRFLTEAQEAKCAQLEAAYMYEKGDTPDPGDGRRWPGSRVAAYYTFLWMADGVSTGNPILDHISSLRGEPPRMRLLALLCRRPTVVPEPLPEFWDLAARYGEPAEAVWKAGRPLCPHMRTDLTGEPQDRRGVVVCPLHRLRVQCGRG
jgi:hypothetical protein